MVIRWRRPALTGRCRLWDLDARGGTVPLLRCPVAVNLTGAARPQLSHDLSRLAIHTDEGHVQIWDLIHQRLLLDRDVEAEALTAMSFNDDLQQFMGWDWARQKVVFGDLETIGESIALAVPRGPIHSASFSRDGRSAVAVEWTGHARVWDTRTGELRCQYGAPGEDREEVRHYADNMRPVLSTDGRRMAVFAAKDAGILDVDSGSWVDVAELDGVYSGVRFSPDGRYLIVNCEPTGVNLIDANTGQLLHLLRAQSKVTASACSPTGHTVAVAARRSVSLWHTETGQILESLLVEEEAGPIVHVQFSADGRHLAAVTAKTLENRQGLATVYIW